MKNEENSKDNKEANKRSKLISFNIIILFSFIDSHMSNHKKSNILDMSSNSRNISKVNSDPLKFRKSILFNQYPSLKNKFKESNMDELMINYLKIKKTLMFLDIFCLIMNIIVVLWLYFNHFQYNAHNYTCTNSDNIQRIICFGFSFCVIISLTARYIIHKKYQFLKYLLTLRISFPKPTIDYKNLLIEVVCHAIQPYPFLNRSTTFTSGDFGEEIIYSLDMFLCVLSFIRFYTVLKIVKIYNGYSNSRGEKINNFYGNSSTFLFLFRTNLINYGFFILLFIFIIIAFIFSICLKIFEDYNSSKDNRTDFSYYFNSLWYILQALINIGFGDFSPHTIFGRLITAFACLLGIFLQSLFIISMFLFIMFSNENESKAYAEINLLYDKEKKNSEYNIYFKNLVKYKFRKLFNKNEKGNPLTLMQRVNLDNEMRVLKEKYYLKAIKTTKIPLTFSDFVNFINKQWEPKAQETMEWWRERGEVYLSFLTYLCDNIDDYLNEFTNFYITNTKLLNLVLFMYLCGPIIPIGNKNEIRGDKTVTIADLEKKIKEFHLKFYDKKIIPTSHNQYMQGLFPAGFDDRSVKIGQNIQGEVFKNMDDDNGEEFEDFSDYYIPGDEEDFEGMSQDDI